MTLPGDHAAPRIELIPVTGIGEVRPGDDLGELIAAHADLQDGDVLVVTSKIVSKAEGRLLILDTDDPIAREVARRDAIDAETVRVVASRGELRIVQTRHGLVMAAAGVDESNVLRHELALLPLDPDTSAQLLRDELRERLGVEVAVIVSDTMGRPWRAGVTDTAIGVAGVTAVTDPRGHRDVHGNTIETTRVALADELAAAADLVKGKLGGVPAAIVRGLAVDGKLPDDGRASRELFRDPSEDMFRLGTAEAVAVGREDAGGALAPAGALHADAVATITALDDTPDTLREAYLGFLAARPDAMWRSCVPGHLTASALVLDPAHEAVLLTLHPRVGRWLQLGGHCEPTDNTLLDAASREAREESGIGALSFDPVPLGLGVHPITCSLGVPTRHFDVRYLAMAPAAAQPVRSDESLDLRWFHWDDLPSGVSSDLPALLAHARERLSR